MWSANLWPHKPGTLTAARLWVIDPAVRHQSAHDPRPVGAATAESASQPVGAPGTAGDVAHRVFDVLDRSELPADALAATRRMWTATVPVLRRLVVLSLVAVCGMAPLTLIGATALRSAAHAMTSDPQTGVQAAWAAEAARKNAPAQSQPEGLRVHVQTQDTLLAGGERQFRLAVDGGSFDAPSDSVAGSPVLLVELSIHPERSGEGFVSVTPTELAVTRNKLHLTPIRIHVAAGVACGSNLGELQVRVRELSPQGVPATTTVALPPVDCRAAPPAIGEPR